jgi:hypothetical protein
MKRNLQSLPARRRWETVLAVLLGFAILTALVVPSPGQWDRPTRPAPELFRVMENDYAHPAFASARAIQTLNRHARDFVGFGGYDEFMACVRVPHAAGLANITRFAGRTLSLLGAEFILRETPESGGPRVFISEPFWERVYQRDGSVVGTTILVNGHAFRIGGITRKTATLAIDTDLWMPIGSEEIMAESGCLRVIGAVRGGRSWKDARKELANILARRELEVFSGGLAAPKLLPVEQDGRFGDTEMEVFSAARKSPFVLRRAG